LPSFGLSESGVRVGLTGATTGTTYTSSTEAPYRQLLHTHLAAMPTIGNASHENDESSNGIFYEKQIIISFGID
jgi:hypothetical protein